MALLANVQLHTQMMAQFLQNAVSFTAKRKTWVRFQHYRGELADNGVSIRYEGVVFTDLWHWLQFLQETSVLRGGGERVRGRVPSGGREF